MCLFPSQGISPHPSLNDRRPLPRSFRNNTEQSSWFSVDGRYTRVRASYSLANSQLGTFWTNFDRQGRRKDDDITSRSAVSCLASSFVLPWRDFTPELHRLLGCPLSLPLLQPSFHPSLRRTGIMFLKSTLVVFLLLTSRIFIRGTLFYIFVKAPLRGVLRIWLTQTVPLLLADGADWVSPEYMIDQRTNPTQDTANAKKSFVGIAGTYGRKGPWSECWTFVYRTSGFD